MIYVAVYHDKGVAESFLPIWQRRLSRIFGAQLGLRFVSAKDVRAISPRNTHMLIMPGGEERFYQEALEPEGNQAIISFVLNGGMYLGVCGGAYYACTDIDFTGKDGRKIKSERSLSFFPGTGVGSIPEYAQGQYYDDDPITASVVKISWTGEGLGGNAAKGQYYHGGCFFVPGLHSVGQWRIGGMYPDGRIAAVQGGFGRGKFFLSGVHMEVDFNSYKDFLYTRYARQTDSVKEQCRAMLALDTETFDHLMYRFVVK